jgi:uncharacterized protein (TIGR03067 family)
MFREVHMNLQWLLLLGTVLLPGADAKEDAVKKELEKFRGTWVMTAVELDGEEPAEQDVTSDARREWIIRGNNYTDGQVGAMYPKREGFLRIDPGKKPKAIDLSSTADFKPGETTYAIYELKGDTLITCYLSKENMKPEERPERFKTAPKSGLVIVHWERKP